MKSIILSNNLYARFYNNKHLAEERLHKDLKDGEFIKILLNLFSGGARVRLRVRRCEDDN